MTRLTRESITDLFTESNTDVIKYLRSRLPGGEDARDLAQEAYLRLLRLKRGDLVRNPEAYLFRIASNLVHEYWLSGQRTVTNYIAGVDLDTIPAPENSPDLLARQQEAMEALERALQALPPLYQQIVIMHRRDGLTYNEISEKLGISPHMVKKNLSKGLARCQERMRHHRIE